jgi:hypothetical protein
MSEMEMLRHASSVRERLRNPGNAVLDVPIDLKRERPVADNSPIPLRLAPVTPYKFARRYPSLDDITTVVCEHFKVTPLDLESDRRTHAVVWPRQVWAYLARILTPSSFPQIGRHLGGRDHTTVLHGYDKVKRLILTDRSIGAEVGAVQRKVNVLFASRNRLSCFDDREI